MFTLRFTNLNFEPFLFLVCLLVEPKSFFQVLILTWYCAQAWTEIQRIVLIAQYFIAVITHFLNEVPPSQFSPTKSQFSPISKIWYMRFQRIFFVAIKLTVAILFLYLSKINWEWELTILVKMQFGGKWTFRGGNLTWGNFGLKIGKMALNSSFG